MAMQPRIAGSSRLAAIPIPNRGGSALADGLQVAAQTFGAIDQSNQQTNLQVDAMNHALDMKKQDEADQLIAMQQTAELAMMESRIERRITDERSNAKMGAVDHTDNSLSIINEELTAFNEGFGQNERVRQRFVGSLTQLGARYQTRETLWESDQFAKAQGEAAKIFMSTTANNLRQNPDRQAAQQAMVHWKDVVVANYPGNDDQKAALLRAGYQEIMGAYFEGLNVAGKFDEADTSLKSGQFNALFDDIAPIQNSVDNERRAAEALAVAEASAARTEVRKGISGFIAETNSGAVKTPAEIKAWIDRATEVGLDPAELVELNNLGSQMIVNRQYSETTDPTGSKAAAEAAMLRAKIDAGTSTDAEEIRAAQLEKVAAGRADKASDGLKELVGQGAQGKMAALEQIDALPESQRFSAANKHGLGYLSGLTAPIRQMVLNGKEHLASPGQKFLDPTKASVVFRAAAPTVLKGLTGDAVKGYMEVTNAIYAQTAKESGLSGPINADVYWTSMRLAFGSTRDSKTGQWKGGLQIVRNRSVIVPDGYTSEQFDTMMSRSDFSHAYYADGSRAAKADILANYAPMIDPDNPYMPTGEFRYVFVGPNSRRLKMKDGQRDFPMAPPNKR